MSGSLADRAAGVERARVELEIVADISAGEIHRSAQVDESAIGKRELGVDAEIVDRSNQANRPARGAAQTDARHEAPQSRQCQRMHPRVNVEPGQPSRTHGEAAGRVGDCAALHVGDVARAVIIPAVEPLTVAVPERVPPSLIAGQSPWPAHLERLHPHTANRER